jgi:uncharacterized protein YkwD
MSRPAQSLRLTLVSALVGLLAASALLTTAGAHAATSYDTSSYAGRLLTLVNGARAQVGLRPLVLAMGTTTVAWSWTQHLADAGALSHNQHLGRDLSTHGSSRWRIYGENVGVGAASDPDGLFEAYMHSPEHRANILNRDYRYVGVAVVFTGSRSWNTFDFVDVYGLQSTPHAGHRQVVQRSAHGVPATPKAHSRPAVAAAAPKPATAVRASVVRSVPVHVKALQHAVASRPVAQHRFVEIAAGSVTAAPAHPLASGSRLPGHRTQPVLLALAVLALAFVSRRWLLVAVRRGA